jgi:hypothetical protein
LRGRVEIGCDVNDGDDDDHDDGEDDGDGDGDGGGADDDFPSSHAQQAAWVLLEVNEFSLCKYYERASQDHLSVSIAM